MSTIYAPNLLTFTFTIATDNYLIFPKNRHRTGFGFMARADVDLVYWIGTTPDPDLGKWFVVASGGQGSNTVGGMSLHQGVLGPLMVLEANGTATDITVLSPILEVPTSAPVSDLGGPPPCQHK